MSTPMRWVLLVGSVVIAITGIVLWASDLAPIALVAVFLVLGLIGFFIALAKPAETPRLLESDDITELSESRRRELMRGTSLYLREMQYRYSIRLDTHGSSARRCFAAEVNTIRLGFLPAVITDNTNDRQGYGFVAFVHDGERWRGPGLPCPADQAEAVQHAARCVSPLSTEEETKFD